MSTSTHTDAHAHAHGCTRTLATKVAMLAHKFAMEKDEAYKELARGRSRDLKKIVSSASSPIRSRRPRASVEEEVCVPCVSLCISISVCVHVGETWHATKARCPRNHNPACTRILFLKPRPFDTPLPELLHTARHTLIAHVHTGYRGGSRMRRGGRSRWPLMKARNPNVENSYSPDPLPSGSALTPAATGMEARQMGGARGLASGETREGAAKNGGNAASGAARTARRSERGAQV
jgi:hypothetical protein